jgi:glucose-1-phosphate cytidylyltransferase
MSDVTIDMAENKMEVHQANVDPWRVTLVDTGQDTMTGGRLKRISSYLGQEDFCLTYGDGLADIDVSKLVEFHKSQGTLATVTSVQAPGRFGALDISNGKIKGFKEKPQGDGAFINGGYFVLSPRVLDYIPDSTTTWEKEPLENLAIEGQLSAFKHEGFWQPMDTLRDKKHLEGLWESGLAPWRVWS